MEATATNGAETCLDFCRTQEPAAQLDPSLNVRGRPPTAGTAAGRQVTARSRGTELWPSPPHQPHVPGPGASLHLPVPTWLLSSHTGSPTIFSAQSHHCPPFSLSESQVCTTAHRARRLCPATCRCSCHSPLPRPSRDTGLHALHGPYQTLLSVPGPSETALLMERPLVDSLTAFGKDVTSQRDSPVSLSLC